MALLLAATGQKTTTMAWLAAVLATLAITLKHAYWRQRDLAPRTYTAGAGTGLGPFGTVKVLKSPHSTDNFVKREMGYTVARKHDDVLRHIATVFDLCLPIVLLLATIVAGKLMALILTAVATIVLAFG